MDDLRVKKAFAALNRVFSLFFFNLRFNEENWDQEKRRDEWFLVSEWVCVCVCSCVQYFVWSISFWASGPVVRPFFSRSSSSSFPRRSLLARARPFVILLSPLSPLFHCLTPWVTRTRKDVWHHPLEMTAIRCLQQRWRRRRQRQRRQLLLLHWRQLLLTYLRRLFMKRKKKREWHSQETQWSGGGYCCPFSSCRRINQYNESIIGG